MSRVALVISISNSQDLQIAERMRRKLRSVHDEVQIFHLASNADVENVSVKGYDGVILGGATNGSTIPPFFAKWVGNNFVRLNNLPMGFFSISPTGEKGRDGAPMDRMVVWFIESIGLRPYVAAEFEGAPEDKPVKPAGLFSRAKPVAVTVKKDFPYDWEAISQFVDEVDSAILNPLQDRTSLPKESIRPSRQVS